MQCDGVGNCSSLAHCKPGGGVWGAAALELRTRASWHSQLGQSFSARPCGGVGGVPSPPSL